MKFRKCPYNFFTESDAHSYLYSSFFRYGIRDIKIPYPKKNQEIKTVLIHREYPTSFRYSLKGPVETMECYELNDCRGDRGHYDMVVLNPSFIENNKIDTVIFKDIRDRPDTVYTLLAAIEFKLLHKPLTKSSSLKEEIKKDFIKLQWSLDKKQAKTAYMLIFNRYGKAEDYWKELEKFNTDYPCINLFYQEAYYDKKTGKKCQGHHISPLPKSRCLSSS